MPSLRSFHNCMFETFPILVGLIMALCYPFKEDCQTLLSTHLLQVIDGAMSLDLCPQAVSQAPQHKLY